MAIRFFILLFIPSVSFAQVPVIGPIQGQYNICALPSQAFTFSVSATNNPTSFSWTVNPAQGATYNNSGASTSVSFPAGNGTYTLYAIAFNASGSSATASFVVNVFETPTVTFSGSMITCQGSPTNIQASATTISASSTLSYSWTPSADLNTSTGYSVIANPSVTTTYSLMLAMGPCTNSALVTVTVKPMPAFIFFAQPVNICAGESSSINIAGTGNFSVNGTPSGSVNVVSPLQTTSYTVQTSLNGCSLQSDVTITVNPLPQVLVMASRTIICKGETATLSFSGAVSYEVNGQPAQSPLVVAPIMTTTYTVKGIDSSQCSSSDIVIILVSTTCLGIIENQLDLQVYPNPSDGILWLEAAVQSDVELYNQLGQRIRTIRLVPGTGTRIAGLSSGMYFLSGDGFRKKIIVR